MPAETSAAMAARCGDAPPTAPACPRPGSGPEEASADRWAPLREQSAEEFLYRFGDAIDDRVAEILDEREARRPRPRPFPGFAAIALLPAVTATVLLWHSAAAVCAIWLWTAVACLAARATRPGRP